MLRPFQLAGLAALLLALILAPASAASDSPQCGDVVSSDLLLTSDLVCSGNGLTVRADHDITINLNGHSIIGTGTGTGLTIGDADFSNAVVTVENGSVRRFGVGVWASSAFFSLGGRQVLDHLAITDNSGVGVSFVLGNTVLSNSLVARNQSDGVSTGGGGVGRQQLINDVVRDNGGDGIRAFEDTLNLLQDSLIAHNRGDGAHLDSTVAAITGNTFLGNGGAGLWVYDRIPAFIPLYLISDNVANQNGNGGMIMTDDSPSEQFFPSGAGNAGNNNDSFQCILIVCAPNRGQAQKSDG